MTDDEGRGLRPGARDDRSPAPPGLTDASPSQIREWISLTEPNTAPALAGAFGH